MSLKVSVIGAGPAGYPAALTAARLGAQVTVIERFRPGGVCLNSGCIPSKSMLDAAHRFDTVRGISSLCNEQAETAAQKILQDISWEKIQRRQQTLTAKLGTGILALFRQAKIPYIEGTAEFTDDHTLSVHTANGRQEVPFDYTIVASGSQAFVPPLFDTISDYVYDNSTIFQMKTLPKTLTIIGGGAIGCEFATLMISLGVTVNLVEMQPRLLPNMDQSLSRLLGTNLSKRGVKLFLGKQVISALSREGKAVLELDDKTLLETDAVLAAIGRTCDLTPLHLERVGISWTHKGIQGVNPDTLRITEHIYAAGDITGLSLLAHAGTRQGIVAASNICGRPLTYHNDYIPTAVYTSPELACVGLTKDQALKRDLEINTHKVFMLANGRAQTMDCTDGFVEIVSDKNSGKILGAAIAAPNASEIIAAVTVALEAGMTVAQWQNVVFAHPTISEALGDALAK